MQQEMLQVEHYKFKQSSNVMYLVNKTTKSTIIIDAQPIQLKLM